MSAKKVGPLIKEARTKAGLTQQALADMIPGLSASEISRAERGEKELTTDELKAIAKATGVTQKSLLEAAGKTSSSSGKTSSSSGKTSSSSGKTSSSSGKTSSSSSASDSMKLTAAEKKLVELYRAADAETKKKVLRILKGESSDAEELISSLLGNALSSLGKRELEG